MDPIALATLFPKVPGHADAPDVNKLRMTQEGLYSITRPPEAAQLLGFMKRLLGDFSKLTITDGTANVGGETIHYALAGFKEVHAIELNVDNLLALRANIRAYPKALVGDRITTHHGDTTQLAAKYKSDILVMDPPWGGPDYKFRKNLDLWLGKHRVDLFIKSLASESSWRPKWVFMKVPFNYNFARLKVIPNVVAAQSQKVRNYWVIALRLQEVI